MFEAGKEYETRDGRRARVYATDGVEHEEIHGAVRVGGETAPGWASISWNEKGERFIDGRRSAYRTQDLMPPKEVRYLNIYEGGFLVMHKSSKDAKEGRNGSMEAIACIRIEYTPGQFDD